MARERGKSFEEIFEEIKHWNHKDKAHFLGTGYAEGVKLYDSKKLEREIDETNVFLYQKCSGKKITSDFKPEEQERLWKLYEETRKWSLDYYDEFYKRFYTEFDHLFFEKDMVARGVELVKGCIGRVFEKSEETVIFPGEKYGLHTRVFITAKGNPTYEGKEMANAFAEYEAFAFDKKIHVVANEQAGYFQVVFKALELIDPEKFKDKQHHLSMGMVQLKDRKMSSRTGDVLTVDWLLDEIKNRVEELATEGRIGSEEKDDTIEKIVIGAVKYSVLKVGTTQDAIFDIESSVSLEGNSGPYLQYTFARTQSVLAKEQRAEGTGQRAKGNSMPYALSSKLEAEERQLLRLLARFPEIVAEAAERLAPNLLCTYLFELAQSFNLFYQKHQILKAEEEVKELRLGLTKATGEVLKEGLSLLGIKAPEKM
jgi:arginyl-tRNA synthetase